MEKGGKFKQVRGRVEKEFTEDCEEIQAFMEESRFQEIFVAVDHVFNSIQTCI